MVASPAFLRFSKLVLVWVFLVIMAGAVVRMTQSGMGCPDWPKCFGKWIPPTNESELPPDFEKYLKQQDIDHSFNVYHTWTEYINRLLGALLGLLLLAQLAWAIQLFWKTNKKIVLFTAANVLLTGFQGWLGKRVVDANLATAKITTHMIVALLIAALALVIIYLQLQGRRNVNKKLANLTMAALALLTVQIILGTAVREQIDEISKSLLYGGRQYWISKLDTIFYIHRSFSLLVTAVCLFTAWKFQKNHIHLWSNRVIVFSVLGEIVFGIILTYFDMPAFAQPLHLLLSSVLFVALCNNWLHSAGLFRNKENI